MDWAELALMEGELVDHDHGIIRDALARLGVADVRAFGLTWEDSEELLHRLGFATRVDVVSA